MATRNSPILDADGKPIEVASVPVVKYKDFVFPIHTLEKAELTTMSKEGVRPTDIITEIRAIGREMRHRFNLLAVGLVLAAKEGPEELENYLNSIGLVITDVKGNTFFQADPDFESKKENQNPVP